jgi:hypothetical protein
MQLKRDFRVAMDICNRLTSTQRSLTSIEPLKDAMVASERLHRHLSLATNRRWHHATRDCADRLRGMIDTLRLRSQHVLDDLQSQSTIKIQPCPSMIYRELRSLRGEFTVVTIDRGSKRLTVRSSTIILEDVHLGRFDIQLNWDFINESSPFNVVAVDPNPASTDDSTTHPHVTSEKLCVGEGASIIRRALTEGRIYDFFCVVDRILQTYNPDSAYVALADWGGVACGECGSTIDPNDCCRCEKCECNLCSDCSRGCCVCSDRYCTDCVSSCTACDDDCCQTCLQSCDGCGESFCSHCITEGKCDDCTNRENEDQPKREAEQTNAPLHPVCVGEATVPA